MGIIRNEPPAWVKNYIGLDFKPRGRNRDGLDCWGLVRLVYAEQFGIYLPSLADRYKGVDKSDLPDMNCIVESICGDATWSVAADRQVGDVSLFRVHGRPHVGIVVARSDFLHAETGAKSCVERLGLSWNGRLQASYRYVGPLNLVAKLNPFEPGSIHSELPAGGNICDIMAAVGVSPGPDIRVYIGDHEVPQHAWGRVRPRPGRRVTVAMVPAGGGGGSKTILRIVASIALIAGAVALGPILGAALGFTLTAGFTAAQVATAASISTGIIGLAGTLAINALIPASSSSYSSDSGNTSSPSLTGSRNALRQYGVVPQPFGAIRMVPPLGAASYTEIVGDDQYLRALFVCGKGRLAMTEPRIGTTDLLSYQGVEIEYREGLPDDPPLNLYPGTVLERSISALLKQSDGWTKRTSDPDATELSVDISFPSGLLRSASNGSRQNFTVAVEVEYAPTGTESWKAINDASPDFSRGLDFLFREPEATLGGRGVYLGPISFGSAAGAPLPDYLPPDGGWSWKAEGYIFAPRKGRYEFALDCSDAGDLSIDSRNVVSWYGSHPADGAYGGHTGAVTLTQGWHRIVVRVESRSADGSVSLGWKPPGEASFTTVPASSLGRLAQRTHVSGLHYTWYNTSAYLNSIVVTSNEAKNIRRSVNWAVPQGQYDIRMRRATDDNNDNSVSDDVYWSTLRSIRNQDPIRLNGVAKIAVRIKATDQLQGTLDDFSVFVQSILPDWDEDQQTWIERATSTPASHYRAVFQGRANATPLDDSRIDLQELQAWAEETRGRGLEYNGIVDTAGTVRSVLDEICAAGRAALSTRDGLFSVVRDRPQSVPRQHFTPRNSFDFKGNKAYPDKPHALRVQFLDRTVNYQRRERIVLSDRYGYTGTDGVRRDAFGGETDLPEATLFETLEIKGIVTAEEAWKHGRYYLAVLDLRPETYEFGVDAEHLVSGRGDLVLLTHDVPLFGSGYGRVVRTIADASDNLTGLVLDSPVTMDAGDNYVIRVRARSGASLVFPVVNNPGVQSQLDLVNPISTTQDGPSGGDLFAFGRMGFESREVIIKSVDGQADAAARLTVVDHAPAIHQADQGVIPPYDAGVALPPSWENRPDAPVIEAIRSDDLVMVRDSSGTLQPRMLISLAPQSGIRPIGTSAEVRLRERPPAPAEPGGTWTPRPVQSIESRQISVFDVEEGKTYQLMVRTISDIGAASNWTNAEHTVIGKAAPPPNVSEFTVTRLSDGVRRYAWRLAVVPPDIAGVRIRYGTGTTWESLTPLHEDALQASPAEINAPDQGNWRFAIKAVDTSGNESLAALFVDTTLGPISLEGVAISDDASIDNWPGVKVNCHITMEGGLESDDITTWDGLGGETVGTWDRWTRWVMFPAQPLSYEHIPLDAGFVFDFSPDVIIEGGGSLVVEVAWSDDDATYSEWMAIAAARSTVVRARYLKARVSATVGAAHPVPRISRMLVFMRAPTFSADLQDIDTAALPPQYRIVPGDLRLPLPAGRFSIVQNVAVTFNGLGPGWSWEMVDRDPLLGPRVRLYNQAGQLSDGLIDARVSGL